MCISEKKLSISSVRMVPCKNDHGRLHYLSDLTGNAWLPEAVWLCTHPFSFVHWRNMLWYKILDSYPTEKLSIHSPFHYLECFPYCVGVYASSLEIRDSTEEWIKDSRGCRTSSDVDNAIFVIVLLLSSGAFKLCNYMLKLRMMMYIKPLLIFSNKI